MKNKFKVPKTIKARNTWFEALTKEEKKVAIAKDVLMQLDLEKYRASSGTYFNLDNGDNYVKDGASLQKVIDGSQSCKVCAIGAVFASKVRLGNKLVVENYMNYGTGVDCESDVLLDATQDVFSTFEMRLMEFFFESSDINGDIYEHYCNSENDYDDSEFNKIQNIVDDFFEIRTSNTRMRDLMQNIIDNNGEFTLHLG